jgi:hypothetical protein
LAALAPALAQALDLLAVGGLLAQALPFASACGVMYTFDITCISRGPRPRLRIS